MIAKLREESKKYGLKLHMGKSKILTNVSCHQKDVLVGDDTIRIITDGAERYLGRKLSLWSYHTIEHINRLAAGWAVFTKNKQVLCSSSFSIQQRFKLFEATVTPCVLFGSAAWTLAQSMEHDLETTRRRMMRMTIGVRQLETEDWPDYMIRATRWCKDIATGPLNSGVVSGSSLEPSRHWVT